MKTNDNNTTTTTRFRLKSVAIALVILLFGTGAGFAIATFFGETPERGSKLKKVDIYEYDLPDPFLSSGEVGPGDSVSIEPVVKNSGSKDLYAFIRVKMPENYENGKEGLYELNDVSSRWRLVDTEVLDSYWYETYQYDETLNAGAVTEVLADKMTMRKIDNSIYSGYSDINVFMKGYVCGTDVAEDMAWEEIKAELHVE